MSYDSENVFAPHLPECVTADYVKSAHVEYNNYFTSGSYMRVAKLNQAQARFICNHVAHRKGCSLSRIAAHYAGITREVRRPVSVCGTIGASNLRQNMYDSILNFEYSF